MFMFRRKFYPAALIVTLFFSLFLFQHSPTHAAECDYTISLNINSVDAEAAGIKPGDVVCITAGTRTASLYLTKFKGTAKAPIIIKNYGGKVVLNVIGNPNGSALSVTKSSHFRLTGSGDEAHEYGIEVQGGTTMGVAVGGLSKNNIEIDHISVHDVGFAGIMLKTDPGCDPATWRKNFPAMTNIRIHDNYVYDTEDGEGFYIGFTFSGGYEVTCDGVKKTVYGHLIRGLKLYNNLTVNTGSEGIQVGSSPGARIYNNTIIDSGMRPFAQYQDNGMQVGYPNAIVYGNWIENAQNTGLIMFGAGHKVYNNVILNSGEGGVYADDRGKGSGMVFVHNTVINSGADGVRVSYDETTPSIFKNNIVAGYGDGRAAFYRVGNSVFKTSNNVLVDNIAEVGFVNAAGKDFHLAPGSQAIDAGVVITQVDAAFDRDNVGRPQGTRVDIGAHEWFPADNTGYTDLLNNGTFEADPMTGWQVQAGGSGKIICNQTDPVKVVAYEGSCAYEIKGKNGVSTTLFQNVNDLTINAGDLLRLEAYIKGSGVTKTNAIRFTAQVFFTDGTNKKYQTATKGGTYGYTRAFNYFAVNKEANKIKVQVQYGGAKGTVRLDSINIGVKSGGALVPLPLAPAEIRKTS